MLVNIGGHLTEHSTWAAIGAADFNVVPRLTLGESPWRFVQVDRRDLRQIAP